MSTDLDRKRAAGWARDLLAQGDFVILDSETTGLGIWSEVIELAVIDPAGQPLLNTRIKPTREIEAGARRIHGITAVDLIDAPGFADVYPLLCAAVQGKAVVVYNADFDLNMLYQSMHLGMGVDVPRDVKPLYFGARCWDCAMLHYAAYVGEWSEYHGDYRYQPLPGGDHYQPLPGGDHSALGDARATLRLVQRMAGVPNDSITVPVMDRELEGYREHYSRFYIEGSWREWKQLALTDALSAFVADLVGAYSDRAGSHERQKLAHDWLTQWRRDQGWRPITERLKAEREQQQ